MAMHFGFACFALCAVAEGNERGILAEMLSFHLSVRDAIAEQMRVTELRRAAHNLRYSRPYWPWRIPQFREPQYQIVPIQRMRFGSMDHAQKMIEDAAVLQHRGVGI